MLGPLYKINSRVSTLFIQCVLLLKRKKIIWGRGTKIFGGIIINLNNSKPIQIGDNCKFVSHSRFNMVGVNKKVSISVGKNAVLKIGKSCGFTGTSIVANNSIIIGDYCNFGGNTFIWDTDFHPLDFEDRRIHRIEKIKTKPIIIGDDVFVGANSIILKGVNLGNRAIVGAGSVVTKNIPAEEVWAGNPAKFIRKI